MSITMVSPPLRASGDPGPAVTSQRPDPWVVPLPVLPPVDTMSMQPESNVGGLRLGGANRTMRPPARPRTGPVHVPLRRQDARARDELTGRRNAPYGDGDVRPRQQGLRRFPRCEGPEPRDRRRRV